MEVLRTKILANNMNIQLTKSPRWNKKWRVIFENRSSVNFGQKGFSDYTIHKDHKRMLRYLNRHNKHEQWNKNGIKTAGFWSRWLLWSKPNLKDAIKLINKKFDVKIRV